jgi:ABC-type transport system involved in Fe-S cluster assembly fused permease/ATPase subunit
MKGKTVIYCAHRLSSIVGVDKIHVLADGQLREQGSHAQLLADSTSLYSSMWQNFLREKKSIEI